MDDVDALHIYRDETREPAALERTIERRGIVDEVRTVDGTGGAELDLDTEGLLVLLRDVIPGDWTAADPLRFQLDDPPLHLRISYDRARFSGGAPIIIGGGAAADLGSTVLADFDIDSTPESMHQLRMDLREVARRLREATRDGLLERADMLRDVAERFD